MTGTQKTLDTMTLPKKIGQMLILGWTGTTDMDSQTANSHAAALVEELAVGGLILMGRNVDTPAQIQALLAEMQILAARQGLPPLFVTIDQEGGPKTHLRPPHFPASDDAWQIGLTGDPAQARKSARQIGQELRSVGINANFAPVLDVNNNPANAVIGRRSYGDTPQSVAAMGVAAVQGYQEDAGILACGKHFPGHGDTDVDSHQALPTISHALDRLFQIELVPFQAAIAAGLAAIMTAHIVFPELDPKLPATLSPAILTGLLRGDLGFEGLIITDCLEMNGVAKDWGEAEATVLAVLAGADILLCCHTWSAQLAIRDSLVAAVETGRIPISRIDASLTRILAAKDRWLHS
ncbi:MAG: beta-N-acetylhexosaminidase [Janthinobacterium lividum]